MLNLNILGEYTKEFVLNKRLRKPTGQSRIDNAETMSILSAQDTGRRQKKNIAHKIKKVTPKDPTKNAEVNPSTRCISNIQCSQVKFFDKMSIHMFFFNYLYWLQQRRR